MTMMMSPLSVQYLPVSSPNIQGTVQRKNATTSTTGVYFLANASTIFSVADRFVCASSTSWMTRDSVESPTVDVVLTTSCVDPTLIDPPESSSPTRFSTGRASPVRLLSSTEEVPSTTNPSAGTLSPVLTLTKLPTGTLDAGTMTIPPAFLSTKFAYSGRRETISPNARRAFSVARASSHSDTEKRKATDAASSNSPKASAPKAAMIIMQLASN
mmetsp:Transcript_15357/g.33183  ORF Transcript_15357/g.33183 Transcript_15357/m.33183 type:complete len:214 (+) Transcript_15357:1378-2019(+)